jgi:hypothetical protein
MRWVHGRRDGSQPMRVKQAGEVNKNECMGDILVAAEAEI